MYLAAGYGKTYNLFVSCSLGKQFPPFITGCSLIQKINYACCYKYFKANLVYTECEVQPSD